MGGEVCARREIPRLASRGRAIRLGMTAANKGKIKDVKRSLAVRVGGQANLAHEERLSVLSSDLSNILGGELYADVACFGVEPDQEFVRQGHANDLLRFSRRA